MNILRGYPRYRFTMKLNLYDSGDTYSYLLGKLLGEYHKHETLKTLLIYFGLLGHFQEFHGTP